MFVGEGSRAGKEGVGDKGGWILSRVFLGILLPWP